LIKGLEITIAPLSYARTNNSIFRIDSNYFKKQYIEDENLIRARKYSTLKEVKATVLSFGAYSLNNYVNYLTSGIPFIRGINMKKGKIDFSNMVSIDSAANDLLWKSEVKPGCVMLSMSGTIGDVALASPHWNYPINSNQDIAKIYTKGKMNTYLLYVFLMSKYGQNYLEREARGSVQQHIFLSQIELLEVPHLGSDFEKSIEIIVKKSEDFEVKYQSLFLQAENLISKEIGLDLLKVNSSNQSVRLFSNSFTSTGRLDAEFYQPKYDSYIELVKNYRGGYAKIRDLLLNNDKNKNLEDSVEYKYIELSNIGKYGNITGYTTNVGSKLPSRARRLVKAGDVVVSSIEGSLDSCVLIPERLNNSICSTGFYVVNSNHFNSSTLLVLFKSELLQNLLKQNCSGTILTALNKDDFLNIEIPKIDIKVQQEIEKLLIASDEYRSKSEICLNIALTSVELAIENNVQDALEYINKRKGEYSA